jgi:hypothetical protein
MVTQQAQQRSGKPARKVSRRLGQRMELRTSVEGFILGPTLCRIRHIICVSLVVPCHSGEARAVALFQTGAETGPDTGGQFWCGCKAVTFWCSTFLQESPNMLDVKVHNLWSLGSLGGLG